MDRFIHPSSAIRSTFPRTLIKTSYYYIRSKSLITLYPTVNKTMFDKGNWQAFTAVINYIADLTVWAATTKEKGQDSKKYNLRWLLPRNRDGPDGRGEMDLNNFPLLDTEAHRNCHAKLYEQLYFNLNSLVPELVSKFPITDYDSEDPNKGYIDEKYTVATDLLWAFKDKYNKTSAGTIFG